ncbi:ABC transporter permease [Nocardioides donggukensis]|uniref:ABC transporter permease n=1 Tax=Nocardioides donggukensis TaxID=2774019 RepID=A0A927PZA5_9ACTN|nr:ABC transporter permease [Nocardioides donggukensis]MBD8869833.1 ABC transporter permease [Nocardioides donggukensis]
MAPDLPATSARPSRWELAWRQSDYWLTVYRRTWRGSVITSFLTPLFYVLAMGVLLGGFIQVAPERLEGATSYLAFVAPGLVAAQSMQLVVGEVTYPVMGMVKWNRIAFGMTATPLGPADVVNAHLGFLVFRLATVSGVFLAVLAPFGVLTSPAGAVGAFLTQILVGLAFATPIYGLSAGLRNEAAFALVFRLGIIPMFLFSGAFFPVGNLSPALETLARLTPLWHGVDLTRMFTLGTLEAGPALVHLGYLLAMAGLGYLWVVRRLTRRLGD